MAYILTRPVRMLNITSYWVSHSGYTNRASTLTQPINLRKEGTRVPKFRWKIAQLEDATSEYFRRSFGYTRTPIREDGAFKGSSPYTWSYQAYRVSPQLSFSDVVPTVSGDKSEQIAASKLAKEIQNARVRWQGAVSIAELGKTRQMISERTEKLFDAAVLTIEAVLTKARRLKRQLRRTKLHPAAQLRKVRRAIGSTYLEGVFGWVPLISDIQDGFEAIDHSVREHFTATGRGKWLGPVINYQGTFGYSQFKGLILSQETRERRVVIKAGYDTTCWLPDRFGFHPADMPLTLWELAPWSFLADYFVPIDDFLSSVMNLHLSPVYCNKGVVTVSKIASQFTRNPDQGTFNETLLLTPGTWHSKSTWFQRSKLLRPPIVSPFRILGPVSDRKALNIAALLNQRRSFESF